MNNLNLAVTTSFGALLLLVFVACNTSEAAQSQEVDQKNEQLTERVFEQILNDEKLFTESP
ncbi:hypothetical protein [Salegentibacter flavus]|uniref:Uncharacterized protein n=1 Tax=Salegentibacter flavus TaxID=287099 RepID=A0A1I4ZJV4_9FLAO|nr:hypothetical protein [Salegentibacter flavus]SFN50488.1 hypothetical protein SAMN05660413_01387 [Salegentibacter flavus]